MRTFAFLLVLVVAGAAHAQAPLLIEVRMPGYGSRSVEQHVLTPLEQQLAGMKAVRRMRGLALDGRCLLRLDLAKDVDAELIRLQVQNRVALARTNLPPQCAVEVLPRADGAFMLIAVQPAADMNLVEASKLVVQKVWPKLVNVPAVARIRVVGNTERRFHIALDPDKLKTYDLSTWAVVSAIRESVDPSDDLIILGERVTMKKAVAAQDLENIPVKSEKNGRNYYLRDVASVKIADETREDAGLALRDGTARRTRRAVFLLAQLAPGKLNELAQKGLQKALEQLQSELPAGVSCTGQMLQASTITAILRLPDTADRTQQASQTHAAAHALLEIPQVHKVFWMVQPRNREAILYVMANADKQADLHKALRARLARIKGASSRVGGLYSPLFPWPSEGMPLVARLYGKDFGKLQQAAERLRKRLVKAAGIVDVNLFPRMRPVVIIDVDREKAGLMKITVQGVARALSGHADNIELPVFGKPGYLMVEGPRSRGNPQKEPIDSLANLPIDESNPLAVFILRDVAKVRLASAPAGAIPHENGQPCVIVCANVAGRTLQEARAEMRRLAQELAKNGVRIEVE